MMLSLFRRGRALLLGGAICVSAAGAVLAQSCDERLKGPVERMEVQGAILKVQVGVLQDALKRFSDDAAGKPWPLRDRVQAQMLQTGSCEQMRRALTEMEVVGRVLRSRVCRKFPKDQRDQFAQGVDKTRKGVPECLQLQRQMTADMEKVAQEQKQ